MLIARVAGGIAFRLLEWQEVFDLLISEMNSVDPSTPFKSPISMKLGMMIVLDETNPTIPFSVTLTFKVKVTGL